LLSSIFALFKNLKLVTLTLPKIRFTKLTRIFYKTKSKFLPDHSKSNKLELCSRPELELHNNPSNSKLLETSLSRIIRVVKGSSQT
jgi:hypothetical protein